MAASVPRYSVAIITHLGTYHHAVAADSSAIGLAPISVLEVTVIAALAPGHTPVPAHCGRRAGRVTEALVPALDRAPTRAAVARDSVAVVTGLPAYNYTIAAHRLAAERMRPYCSVENTGIGVCA